MYFEYFVSDVIFSVQEDVHEYRSHPPLPGIFRPFHLLPSAHALPKPDPEDPLSMESYIDSFDSEFGRAEAGGSAGKGGEQGTEPQSERRC